MGKRGYILLILLAAGFIVYGQVEHHGRGIVGFGIVEWHEINIDPVALYLLENKAQNKDDGFQFAVPVSVALQPDNSGFWREAGEVNVWTVGIRSKNAKSLNLILEPFNIPAGSEVYVYDTGRRVILGAFGSDNNSSSKILPVLPVPGDEVILEYHLPEGADWRGTLGIAQVAHDFVGILGYDSKDNRFNLSQPCNLDINCPEAAAYEVEKRSVCRIIVRGIELCTGVLLNNTNGQNRALTLTAQHCITNSDDAARSVFVFNYESPWCNGPDGRVHHSISGSTFRASKEEIDFSLVELSSFPPFTYKPYLAGWDVSGIIPQRTVSIHHPMGDVMKISIDRNPPVTSTFSGYSTNGFWKVLQWETGTTEGGSSGAPLFDQNKRVVGILTGGEAVCGRSVNDYFAKLSSIYNLSSVLWEHLKGWIDPALSGVKTLNGRDPYENNLLTVDTLSNMGPAELLILTPYSIPGNGYTTGFNSDSLVMYAEYFQSAPGRHLSEVIINIGKVRTVLSADSARIYIMKDGAFPGDVLTSLKIMLNEAKDTFLLKADFRNTLPLTGNFYVGWKIWYADKAVSETRQFAAFHSPGRSVPELNTAWFNDGSGWKKFTQHPYAPAAVSLDVRVVTIGDPAVNSISEVREIKRSFIVYPNPAGDYLVISSAISGCMDELRFYDGTGRMIKARKMDMVFPGEAKINLADLAAGIYFLEIRCGRGSDFQKIIIGR